MHRSGSAYVSPGHSSLLSLKPRQIILAELAATPMEKSRLDNIVGLKPQEFLLTCSIALWLENKGFSKVLKRLISAAQIKGDDWKSKALNLDQIFSNYLENCNDIPKDANLRNKPEKQVTTSTKDEGDSSCVISKETSKKMKMENAAVTENEKPPKDTMISVKVNESKLKFEEGESGKTLGTLSGVDLEKVLDFTGNSIDAFGKKKKDKKHKKINEDSSIAEEMTVNVAAEVTKEKKNCVSSEVIIVKSKDEKQKKKMKADGVTYNDMNRVKDNNSKLIYEKNEDNIELRDSKVQPEEKGGKKTTSILVESTISSAKLLGSEYLSDGKPEKALAKAVVDAVNESKKSSKKRKRLTSVTDEILPALDIQAEESKRRKTKAAEPFIISSGENGHINGYDKENDIQVSPRATQDLAAKQTSESLNVDIKNGTNKLDDPKSSRKRQKNSVEPKSANAFQRVKVDEVDFVDDRLQDNSYWAKGGAETGYGAKAQEVLGQVKGRGFRHEKTKKKRGSYRGGQIDMDSHSIKFNYSDEE